MVINMRNVIKKIGLSIAGLVQGTLGSYFALLGYALAFPDTEPGMRDYEEDMFFVPWGFVMMLIGFRTLSSTFSNIKRRLHSLQAPIHAILI